MANDPVKDALDSAHKALDSANNFQSSAGGPMVHRQSANAPYSLAAKARGVVHAAVEKVTQPAKENIQEASDTAQGIKNRQENAHAAGLN
jgi:hypothetical protein